MLNVVLTDGEEILKKRTVTQCEYEELQKKADDATGGEYRWEILI